MASLYYRNTGTGSYSTVTNWSLTDGGVSAGVIPTTSDDAFFTANSGSCTVGSSSNCRNIDFTGYTGNLFFSTASIVVNGNITLSPTMTITTTSGGDGLGYGFSLSATSCTIASKGINVSKLIPNVAGITITLLDTLSIAAIIISANNVTWVGSIFIVGSFVYLSTGTPVIFKAGNNYQIGNLVDNYHTGIAHGLIRSDTPGTQAIVTVTGSCNTGYLDFTDIDASQGIPILTFMGVVTNSNNIFTMVDSSIQLNPTTSGMLTA
jgi:hypothetical protein